MNATKTTTTLDNLVQKIFSHMADGTILDAMNTLYDDNVQMQENANPPTVGLPANIEREKQFLANVKEWKSLDLHAVATKPEPSDPTSGVALVEYAFEFINQQDQPVRYEQVAVQHWKNGKITRERFYYNAG